MSRRLLLALALILCGCRSLPPAPWKRGYSVKARVTRPALGTYDIQLELRDDGRKLLSPRAVVRFDEWSTVLVGETLPVPPPPLEEAGPGEEEARGLRDGVVVAVRCASHDDDDRVDLEVRLFTVEDGRIEVVRETLDLALGEQGRVRD